MSTRRVEVEIAKLGHVLSHATIANYEKGRSKPTLHTVGLFAEVYERPINWFLQSGPILSNVEYRSLKSVRQGDRRKFDANAHRWLEAYRNLEQFLLDPLIASAGDFRVDAGQSGEELASELRRYLGCSEDRPIDSLVGVLEKFGIRVIEFKSVARIDALAGLLGDEKVVVLNAALSNDRVRLTSGHELAHHLYCDCLGSGKLTKTEIEQRAFEFASHFLIPEPQLELAFQGMSLIRLMEFKGRFGVSMAAMIFRGRIAGILNKRTYERIWIEFSKRGWREQEPGTVTFDRPRRFERLLESAIGEKKLTWRMAEHVTGIRQSELRSRILSATERTIE